MNPVKKALFANGLKKFADKLDEKDLAFVARVASDPGFDRLMEKISDGAFIVESVRKELSQRLPQG